MSVQPPEVDSAQLGQISVSVVWYVEVSAFQKGIKYYVQWRIISRLQMSVQFDEVPTIGTVCLEGFHCVHTFDQHRYPLKTTKKKTKKKNCSCWKSNSKSLA